MNKIPRSYARIWWQSDKPGLQMASLGCFFFLHADSLIAMHSDPDSYQVIKWRHKNPDLAIGCHAGDVVGRLDLVAPEITRVKLYFGERSKSVEVDDDGRLLHIVGYHSFYFFRVELNDRVKELKRIIEQNDRFKELKLMAETVLPAAWDGNLLK